MPSDDQTLINGGFNIDKLLERPCSPNDTERKPLHALSLPCCGECNASFRTLTVMVDSMQAKQSGLCLRFDRDIQRESDRPCTFFPTHM